MTRPRCGNDPRAQLTPGDAQVVADFRAYLARRHQERTMSDLDNARAAVANWLIDDPKARTALERFEAAVRATAADLTAMFEGLGRLLATSSRDWGQYAPDAWLYAVICGWDCEEPVHDETCTHGAMEEMQRRHGWSDEAVAKARRYRAAVRTLTCKARP